MHHIRAVTGFTLPIDWSNRVLLWICCGIVIALQYCAPARAQTRQIGIDTPVQWYADSSDALTLDGFLALPASALSAGQRIPSFGYSSKSYWLQTHLPASYFQGETRWLQIGPSFVDHLNVYYRPAGSDLPWTLKAFGDRASTRASDLNYRESVLILPPPPNPAGYDLVFRLQSSSTLILLATLSSPQEFVQAATQDTAFWSFYFGLAFICTGGHPGHRILEFLLWSGLHCQRGCLVARSVTPSPPAVGDLPVFP